MVRVALDAAETVVQPRTSRFVVRQSRRYLRLVGVEAAPVDRVRRFTEAVKPLPSFHVVLAMRIAIWSAISASLPEPSARIPRPQAPGLTLDPTEQAPHDYQS